MQALFEKFKIPGMSRDEELAFQFGIIVASMFWIIVALITCLLLVWAVM